MQTSRRQELEFDGQRSSVTVARGERVVAVADVVAGVLSEYASEEGEASEASEAES